MTDSKIFVGLRPTGKKKPVLQREESSTQCQWDDCDKPGSHRAPVGRDAEGLYLLFCSEHVKQYNKGYNYSTNLSDPETARYQREAAAGKRRTVGASIKQPSEAPLPSTARSGSAKATNARKTEAQRQAANAQRQKRKLKVLEAKAFDALGLSEDATADEIRSQYKLMLKMYHPDLNQGDRDAEDKLRGAIDAHKILKLNGFC